MRMEVEEADLRYPLLLTMITVILTHWRVVEAVAEVMMMTTLSLNHYLIMAIQNVTLMNQAVLQYLVEH